MAARSRADYFDAGLRLLAEGGVQAVTIANLCVALGVTKGSFYHHFDNVEAYRGQLLNHWAIELQRQVAEEVASASDPMERLEALRLQAVHAHHEAEAAIRLWARSDVEASRLREKVDSSRERAVTEAYRAIGVPREEADMLGKLAVVVLIGAQQREAGVDRDRLAAMYRWLHESAVRRLTDVPA